MVYFTLTIQHCSQEPTEASQKPTWILQASADMFETHTDLPKQTPFRQLNRLPSGMSDDQHLKTLKQTPSKITWLQRRGAFARRCAMF